MEKLFVKISPMSSTHSIMDMCYTDSEFPEVWLAQKAVLPHSSLFLMQLKVQFFFEK